MSVAMPVIDEQPRTTDPQREVWQSNGRLRVQGLSETDRNFAVAMHLSPYGFFIIGPLVFLAPLVLWLVRKEHSAFNDDHGREIVNYMISSIILSCTIILIPVILVVAAVNFVRAAIAAGRGEFFRYPMTFRFL